MENYQEFLRMIKRGLKAAFFFKISLRKKWINFITGLCALYFFAQTDDSLKCLTLLINSFNSRRNESSTLKLQEALKYSFCSFLGYKNIFQRNQTNQSENIFCLNHSYVLFP
jgi:hypothetical protein